MALHAQRGCAAIQADGFPISLGLRRVTLGAADFIVRTVEGEARLVVIERTSAPPRNRMTCGAIALTSRIHELPAVNIFMALEALLRRL